MSEDAGAPGRRPEGSSEPDGDAATPPTGIPAAHAEGAREPATEWQQTTEVHGTGEDGAATAGFESGGPGDPGGDEPRRGSVRYQDPESTTPREPTVAEQRARREAERRRKAQEEASAAAAARKSKTRKRVLIGGGVAVGVVAIIAIAYAASSGSDDSVNAQCTDQNGVVVDDSFCSGNSVAGSYHGGFVPIFLGGFGNQYHYNYGSSSPIGTVASGGSTTAPPSGTSIRSGTSGSSLGSTSSNGTVSRGGLGVSGSSSSGSSSGSKGSSGSSGGSSSGGSSSGGSSSGS
jgi:hypothetical protein